MVRWVVAALLAAATAWPCACSRQDQAAGTGQGAKAADSGRQAPARAPGQASAPATAPASRPAARIEVDRVARRVSVPVTVARQGQYAELKGAIEYVLVSTGGKDYETVFTTPASPREIQDAMASIGFSTGSPATEDEPAKGKPLRVFAEYVAGGKPVRRPVEDFLLLAKTGKPPDAGQWVYTGSAETTDPATGRRIIQAELTRSVIGLHTADASALVHNARPESRQENAYRANATELPAAAAAARLVLERVMPPVPPGVRRVHVFVSGRVQGVGFRAFTQGQAGRRQLTGWVRNLSDGRVEAVVEGPTEKVAELLKQIGRGPRAAVVEKVEVTDEPAEGDSKQFEVTY